MASLSVHDIEIMAPAGSWESLYAALHAGADSVYFGIENLNMRSHSSNNFTINDLREIVRLCHEHKVKSYLTINTILYDEDIELMHQIVDTAQEEGISAIIAADVAVLTYARSKGVEVHLSTQLNISNVDALIFYAQFADVVVLARELTMNQVAHIFKTINDRNICGPSGNRIRIEMFCHGALCMAVSGKCYLSLHEMNKSANRGSCMQICRRSYEVKDKELGIELEVDNEYIMSPKDLKTIHFVNKMIDAGVRVFKIEGRARSAEYVKATVSSYKEAIRAYIDNTFTDDKIADWDKRLSKVFNRGFWDGYYLGQRLGEWSANYGSQATHRKVYIGKVTNYFKNIGVAEILVETQSIETGNEILITGETTGAYESIADDIRVNLISVNQAKKGDLFSIKTTDIVRRNDKVFKIVPAKNVSITQ
ncbi:MAG: U32 family peptidase [Paludibacteraceae bacterium]|nr:U32 family peptidase [Paludibacteraceae bacterium]NLK92861.1 U32 family peptidase [Bacteroidales bacterium]MBP6436814.1 U32 family peptidase [Paludibacteraceae bacterium]MBP8627384.1 U32 family peptidase [Paludibacteraceae bacterium]MBP9648015.1 U32 family peptidase [Paludibacteraceae bacterium]